MQNRLQSFAQRIPANRHSSRAWINKEFDNVSLETKLAEEGLSFRKWRMAQEHSSGKIPLKVRRWKTDEVFLMLKEPFRRQVLRSLAKGEMKMALKMTWLGMMTHA